MSPLSAVLPLGGSSTEEFGRPPLALAVASKRVADALSRAEAEGGGAPSDSAESGFMRG